MTIRIFQADAFTDAPFRGNPAAVCLLTEARDPGWMQDVAREMNLSETAFLARREAGGFDLRWFTPAVEVALCGHATLATAHVLWETGQLDTGTMASFHARSGILTAERHDDGLIQLDFPTRRASPMPPPPGLVDALGARPVQVGRNVDDYLVELESEGVIRSLRPDVRALRALPIRGIIVTARSSSDASPSGVDFVSRFFAPAVGVDEDPVTGSAHCCLAPYWSERLGKLEMTGYQASTRGGIVHVRVVGDRVKLAGRAVTVLGGELRV